MILLSQHPKQLVFQIYITHTHNLKVILYAILSEPVFWLRPITWSQIWNVPWWYHVCIKPLWIVEPFRFSCQECSSWAWTPGLVNNSILRSAYHTARRSHPGILARHCRARPQECTSRHKPLAGSCYTLFHLQSINQRRSPESFWPPQHKTAW